MAELFGPRCMPQAFLDLEITIAVATDDATGTRWAKRLRAAHGNARTTIPATVCSLSQAGWTLNTLWKGAHDAVSEEDTQMDRNRRVNRDGDTSYRPLDSFVAIGQTA